MDQLTDHSKSSLSATFAQLANRTASASGNYRTFIVMLGIVILWAMSGPFFGFSETWQLVINTGTTIITFLMVFLIQNTQNRDSDAMQIKLDELIRATKGAHTVLLDLEELDDKHLASIKVCYEAIATKSRKGLKKHKDDTGVPFIHIETA